MLPSPVSSDADLQWGQSSLFTQGLRDLRLGGPCKLSLSSLHPPSPRPQGGAFQHLGLEAWGASQGPPFLADPEAHRLSPEHHEVTDTQHSASLGRVLGTCSVPPFFLGSLVSDVQPDLSGLHSNFCLPSPGSLPEPCQPVPLLDLSPAFSPRVGFAQMP